MSSRLLVDRLRAFLVVCSGHAMHKICGDLVKECVVELTEKKWIVVAANHVVERAGFFHWENDNDLSDAIDDLEAAIKAKAIEDPNADS